MVTHIWRERYILSCIATQNMANGAVFGFPAILTPVITSNSTLSDIHVTTEEASWITAAQAITGPIGFLFLPSLMQIYGRRFVNIIMNLVMLVGTLTIALASNLAGLIAGRAIQGLVFCQLFISSILICEYSHPKRRGVYIVLKTIVCYIGLLLCHSLSAKLHWREIAWISTIPSILEAVVPLTWPESPPWLAYKERYDDCAKSFEWLRGKSLESRTELKEILTAQREIRRLKIAANSGAIFLNAFRSKQFLKPFFISVCLIFVMHSSGLYYLLAYTIQIISEMTGDKSNALYYTVGIDLMKLLASASALVSIKMFRRRTLILTAGTGSCLLLALTSLLDYLNKKHSLNPPWLSPIVLAVYGFVANLGLIPLVSVVKGEIFPLQFKGIGTTSSGVINALTGAVVLKITSNLLESVNTYGTFCIYSTVMALFLVILYFILPETKDRTLQDIENEFLNLKINNDEVYGVEMKVILSK